MRFVFLFFLSVFISFAPGWSACYTYADSYSFNGVCSSFTFTDGNFNAASHSVSTSFSCGDRGGNCSSYDFTVRGGSSSPRFLADMKLLPSSTQCFISGYTAYINVSVTYCATQCEADSVKYALEGCPDNGVWLPDSCKCSAPPDTTYHCQNSGGSMPGGVGGAPSRALLFRCIGGVCTQTVTLNGTCQNWGFCGEGEDDCDVPPDSTGHPPCGRSGAEWVSGSACYYSCANGRHMRCAPVSTDYVAGAVYAARCPGTPPASCYPSSSSANPGSSSSGGGNSSSSGGDSSSSGGGDSSGSGGGGSSGSGGGSDIDYTQLLDAIRDTLHRANVQREGITNWRNDFMPVLNNIDENTLSGWRETYELNNKLTSLQENGVTLTKPIVQDLDSTHILLDEINRYLRTDSVYPKDTTYNPLLRDIKTAIDSVRSRDSSVFVRDTAFAKWFADYASDTAQRNGVLGDIYRNTALMAGDSVKNGLCSRFMTCYTPTPTFANAQACAASVGVSLDQCLDGGSPFDSHLNVGVGILRTIWDVFFGDDTTEVTFEPIDSAVSFSPAMSQAFDDLSSANVSVNLDSLKKTIDDVKARLDSARARQTDSVSIQPDSLWLDSADAAKYVQTLLLPSGTGTDCFICHADLGNFGGLSRQNLSIHIDFSNFGGYNFCEIIRVVIRIATLVTCISLTLGSWAAAFGYNPKNDA